MSSGAEQARGTLPARWIALGLALSAMCGGPSRATAQSAESPLLAAGQLRLEFLPEVRLWTERYGGVASPWDQVEPLGFDFTRAVVDSAFLPALGTAQESLRTLLADSALTGTLGATNARISAFRTELPLGVGLGVFDWLTVGVKVPLVRRRVEVDLDLDPAGATLGRSPGLQDATVQSWLAELGAIIDHVTAEVDARCATLGTADPACVQGMATVERANEVRTNLGDAFLGLLFPTSGSPAASRLLARISDLNQALLQEGDSAFITDTWVTPLPFAGSAIDASGLQTFLTDPAYGIDADPIASLLTTWELGDIEVSAALRLLDRPQGMVVRNSDAAGDSVFNRTVGFLLGVGATYRFGTGTPDLARNFVDLGSGDGQDDVEVQVFGRLDLGSRLRTRFEGRLGFQQEGLRTMRIGGPEEALRPSAWQTALVWEPGDYREFVVAPEIRVAPEFSLGLRYHSYSKDADRYRFEDTPLVDPALIPRSIDLLSQETERNVRHLGIGATLWPSRRSAEEGQWPLAVSAEYQLPLSGSGGQTPKDARFRVSARLFVDLW